MPFFYLCQGVKLVGRLDEHWYYKPGPDHTANIISFMNYLLIMPALLLQLGWHGVIAYSLHALVARRLPASRVHVSECIIDD